MRHLAGHKLVGLFLAFAGRGIEEYTEHGSAADTCIVAVPSAGDPPHLILDHDPEIDLVGSRQRARREECRANIIAVGGVDTFK